MSDRLYQEVYKKFNDKQKDTMYALYMTGINYDGHSMVTYGDVEKSVAIVTKETYKQAYNDAIEECIKHIKLNKYNDGTYVVYDEILDEIAEQLKGAEE